VIGEAVAVDLSNMFEMGIDPDGTTVNKGGVVVVHAEAIVVHDEPFEGGKTMLVEGHHFGCG
jgi:hypothetical protein